MVNLRQQATYDSKEQEVAREYFDINKWCEIISPSRDEMRVAQKGAIAITVYEFYEMEKGSRCHFPSAEDFISNFLDVDITGPAQPKEESRKNTDLLHLSRRLFEEAKEQISLNTTESILIFCPYCDQQIVTTHLGIFPSYNSETNELNYSDGPKIIGLEIPCNCKGYSVGDIDRLEVEAIEKMNEGLDFVE